MISRTIPDGPRLAELAAGLLRDGLPVRFAARGASMAPFIRDGDRLTVVPVRAPDAFATGDVAAYLQEGTGNLRLHRLVRRTHSGWLARGDRLGAADAEVGEERLLGRVSSIEREGRAVRLFRGRAAVLLSRVTLAGLELRRLLSVFRKG